MKKKIIEISIVGFLVLVSIGALVCTFLPFIIILNGQNEVDCPYLGEYVEEGGSIIANLGEVRIEGVVDTSKMGKYVITYRFLNAKRERIVTVKDMDGPAINLTGRTKITIAMNGEYKEYGYSAIDTIDGDCTSKVVVTNEVDVNKAGTYYVTYQAEDSSGNKTKVRRTIEVVENGPLVQSIKDFSLNGYFNDVILTATSENTDKKFKELMFFGDSVIGNLAFEGKSGIATRTWTRGMMDSDNIYTREVHIAGDFNGFLFLDKLAEAKPDHLLVLLGTNVVPSWSVEYFINSYEQAMIKMKAASPDTTFIILSLFPVTGKYADRNEKINQINYYLCELCQEYGFYFMNAAEVIKGSDGIGQASLIKADSIHPNASGSNLILEYIKNHLSY